MCKKVDGLLDTLETEINNSDFDVNSLTEKINGCKLDDYDVFRITRILMAKKGWHWTIMLLFFITIFYVILSAILSLAFTMIFFLLSFIFPLSVSTSVTLVALLITVSSIQCK